MPRVRLGVALLVPEPVDREIDGLRRACGDGAFTRVVPHLTLVPPVNVRVDDLPAALAVLRRAGARLAPVTVTLGAPTSFLPDSETLYLPVPDAAEADAVRRIRDAVFVEPLARPLTWPFVPHVTLADQMVPTRIAAAEAALADFRAEVTFDRVHLLIEARHGDAHRRWSPIADVPFAPPIVVGRGGVELELLVSELVDPEGDGLEEAEWAEVEDTPPSDVLPAGARSVVVTARTPARGGDRGSVVGVARGWARDGEGEVVCITVASAERRRGVARQLHLALASAIAGTAHDGGD